MSSATLNPTWNQIVDRVATQQNLNFDIKASPREVHVTPNGLLAIKGDEIGFNATGLGQFARKIGVPQPYAAKLRDLDRELFAVNANRWLHDQNELDQDKPLLFRATTIDNGSGAKAVLRAVLSDRYGILDNDEVLNASLAAFEDLNLTDKLSIHGAWLTPESFHVRLSSQQDAIDAAKAAGHNGFIKGEDILFPMLHLSNSEIGRASVRLEGGVYRVVCTNGLVRPHGASDGGSKRHYGNTQGELNAYVLKAAEEILRGAVTFTGALADSQGEVIARPTEYVENLVARNRVSRKDETAILAELAKSFAQTFNAPTTKYDVINAITAVARDHSPEDRIALERIASTVISKN